MVRLICLNSLSKMVLLICNIESRASLFSHKNIKTQFSLLKISSRVSKVQTKESIQQMGSFSSGRMCEK